MVRGPYDTGRFAAVDTRQVGSRNDLADLVDRMRADLLGHPDEWENATLERYLEALAASTRDIAGGYANHGVALPEQPTWQFVAELLVMATGYE